MYIAFAKFYWICGYGLGVGNHRVALMMKRCHGQTSQLHNTLNNVHFDIEV